MYGEVVESVPVDWWTGKPTEGLYICEKDFLNDLEQYKEKSKITVRINSVGGDLDVYKRQVRKGKETLQRHVLI